MVLVSTIFGLLLPIGVGYGQALPFVKARDLGQWCAEGDPKCVGYVAGVADLLATRREACFDVGEDIWDISSTVSQFIAETSGIGYMRASEAVERSLVSRFPCP